MTNMEKTSSGTKDVEINLIELFAAVWKEKLRFSLVTLLFLFGSIFYAYVQPVIYRAEALVAPVAEEQNGGFIPSQLGLVANIAGLNTGQESSKSQKAISILRSREFIQQFTVEHELEALLLASNWDDSLQGNVIDAELYDVESQSWMAGEQPENDIAWEVFKVFSDILRITEDANTAMISISVEWTDPVQASHWVNWLIADINRNLKQSDFLEANNAIAYLTDQISNTQLVEMQRVFYDLIESQMRIAMLANVREEYVLEVIDAAVVPQEKVRPRRLLIISLGALIGVLLALVSVLAPPLFNRQLAK